MKAESSARSRGAPHIPRPLNSFLIFRGEQIPIIYKERGYLVQPVVSAIVSAKWKALTAEEKAVYTSKAEKEKLAHAKRYPGYKYAPVTRQMKERKKQVQQEEKIAKEIAKEEARELKRIAKSKAMAPSASLNRPAQLAPRFIPPPSMPGTSPFPQTFQRADATYTGAVNSYYRSHTFSIGATQQEGAHYTQAPAQVEQQQFNGAEETPEQYDANATQAYHTFNIPIPFVQTPDVAAEQAQRQPHAQPLYYDAQAAAQHDLGEAHLVGALDIAVGEMGRFDLDNGDHSQWGNIDLEQWALGIPNVAQGDSYTAAVPQAGPSTQAPTPPLSDNIFGFGEPGLAFAHADDDSFDFSRLFESDAPLNTFSDAPFDGAAVGFDWDAANWLSGMAVPVNA